MKRTHIPRRLAAGLCLLLCALCLAPAALAAGRTCSLTVDYSQDGQPCSDVGFRLYRAAELNGRGTWSPTGPFAGYPLDWENLDSGSLRDLAETLSAYAARAGLEPVASGRTGADGKCTFSSLPAGLYLVVGEPHMVSGKLYTPAPFLAALPALDDDGQWVYDVTAAPKPTPPEETDQIQVVKVWADAGYEDQRPSQVVVELLRDGQVWDTVTLNAAGGWRYAWTGLEPGHQWQVVEREVPEGYTVSVSREGVVFTVTNTVPGTPDVPEPPDEPGPSVPPDIPDGPDEPELPYTGQLWWPAPVLAMCGMILFLLGWAQNRMSHHEEDER